MENSVLVEIDQGEQDLVEEALGLSLGKRLVSMLLHVLLEIEFQVLEHQVKLVLGVDDLL